MDALELKIPPPLLWSICALLAWLTAQAFPGFAAPVRAWRWLAVLPVLAALMLGFPALQAFIRARTTFHPHRPSRSSSLVTGGVFRFSRNPMYLALALMLLAWIVLLGNVAGLLWLAAFIAYITRFQIVPEERALAAKFGQEYAQYCARVRRWI